MTAPVEVILLGAGTIGRALLAQVARNPAVGRRIRVAAVIDTSGHVFAPHGLEQRGISAIERHKRAGRPIASLADGTRGDALTAIEAIAAAGLARPVLVDATAADTTHLLERALAHGWDLVLANKLPLSGESPKVDRLHRLAREQGSSILHEATVGAGLPVIDTMRKLVESGDRIRCIEGCPSGTLGFLFGELGRGRAFSAALRSAVSAGYTEPDPRADLSGADVARKSLILGRLIGFTGELGDIRVESLVPPSLRDVPREEFLARLEEEDAEWAARVDAARAAGQVLRYRARVTPRRVDVGIVGVVSADPLAALSGTDNQFAFTTTRYRPQPLVITGPGAGPAVTAAGVVNDLLRLAAEGAALRARYRPRDPVSRGSRDVAARVPAVAPPLPDPDAPSPTAERAPSGRGARRPRPGIPVEAPSAGG